MPKRRVLPVVSSWLLFVACSSGSEPMSDELDELDEDGERVGPVTAGGAGGRAPSGGAGGQPSGGRGGSGGNGGGPADAGVGGGAGGRGGAAGAAGGAAGGAGGSAGAPNAAPVKIQPLGDSITQGKATAEEYTYRRPLWKKLQAAGYAVDFVGSTDKQLGEAPHLFDDYDHDHEGHYGWKITDVLPKLDGWLAGYTPDVSLIHLGTNDQGSSTFDQMIANTEMIISKLRTDNPRIKIGVAKLIEPGPRGVEFSAKLPAMAQRLSTAESPIVVVDQDEGFTSKDTLDGIHPNPMGAERIATRWFDALVKLLPAPR